jgi:MerR family mercuric resistance operon transcriptional regulator
MRKIATELTIGALSDETGVNVETIRYYEREGLLPRAPRTAGGHRVFGKAHLRRLFFIRRSRELGFSGTKIADLRRLEQTLAAISSKCAGDDLPDCPIVEALSADHP